MATIKTKRSVHPAQLLETARRNNRRATTRHSERGKPAERRNQNRSTSPRSASPRKLSRFPEAKGKTVASVELSTATDYQAISINFQDKTCLHFSLETGLTVKTDYSDWKTGNQRIIRRWPLIRSQQ